MSYGPNTRLKALDWHQNRSGLHPLTCGRESCDHVNLEGCKTANGTVYLECPECGWMQCWDHDYLVDVWRKKIALGVSLAQAPLGKYSYNMGQ